MKNIFFKTLLGGLAILLLILGSMLFAGQRVTEAAQGLVIRDTADLPSGRVALVLGCSPTVQSGRPNLFFRYRIEAAARLYHAGKASHLLVSGDNRTEYYDEPTAMTEALVKLDVPRDKIVRDYAGLSTLDSVVRAREIFGQDKLIIVSQTDHAVRAVYIAKVKGIDACAYPARDVGSVGGFKQHLREVLARVKTVLDVNILNRQPRHLGPKVDIASAGDSD